MIGPPPIKSGNIDPALVEFLSEVYYGVAATQSSGPTSKRPTKDLFPGRFYFDTSLGANGKPIWVNKNATGWVLADGTAA